MCQEKHFVSDWKKGGSLALSYINNADLDVDINLYVFRWCLSGDFTYEYSEKAARSIIVSN